MTARDFRLLTFGALAGLGLAAAVGAARLQPEPTTPASMTADMRITWSTDGRTVYLWRIVGNSVEYQSTWHTPGMPRPQSDDGRSRDESPAKDKGDQPSKPKRPGPDGKP
jgi:hypothetical protein